MFYHTKTKASSYDSNSLHSRIEVGKTTVMSDLHRYTIENVWEAFKGRINYNYDEVVALVQGSLLTACCCFGVVLNILALFFFLRRSTAFKFKVVLGTAAFTDLMICSLAAFVTTSYFGGRRPMAFSNELFCQIWGSAWSLASRFSVNIVCITSVMRVMNIYNPSMVTITKIKITLIADALILFTIESFPFLYKEKYTFAGIVGACVPGYGSDNMGPASFRSLLLSYIPVLVCSLPIFMSLCCYIIVTYKLLKQRASTIARLGAARQFQTQAMITILSFMAVHLLFQAPLAVYLIWLLSQIFGGSSAFAALSSDPWWFSLYMPSFVYITCVAVNAAINPIIYYWRLPEFRAYVKQCFLEFIRSCLCLVPRLTSRRTSSGTRTVEIFNVPFYRPLYWENIIDWDNALAALGMGCNGEAETPSLHVVSLFCEREVCTDPAGPPEASACEKGLRRVSKTSMSSVYYCETFC